MGLSGLSRGVSGGGSRGLVWERQVGGIHSVLDSGSSFWQSFIESHE